jgi:hypothetical protein
LSDGLRWFDERKLSTNTRQIYPGRVYFVATSERSSMTSLWGTRDRLLRQLDRLLGSGRITSAEANRLRGATNRDEFDAAARDISVRHARVQLDAAVEAGEMTEEEAHKQLDVLRSGEHRRTLRGHSRRKHQTT